MEDTLENRRILVIDDDHAFCELVTSMLSDAGFEVLSAFDGPTGIETARAQKPAVILLDMIMPAVDGIGTLARLKRDLVLAEIPVVGVTGSPDLTYVEKTLHTGAEFFLPKPFGAVTLVRVVKLAAETAQDDPLMRHRRRRSRFQAKVPVRCLIGQDAETTREVVGQTGNVSLSGLLLFLSETLEPGSVLRLQLDLPDGPITVKGTVIWQAPQPTREGKTPHGIRLLRFAEDAGLGQYRRYLSQLAAEHAAR